MSDARTTGEREAIITEIEANFHLCRCGRGDVGCVDEDTARWLIAELRSALSELSAARRDAERGREDDGPPFDDGTRKAMMNAALRLADTLDAEHGRVTNAGSTIRRLVKHLHRERAEVDRFKRADKIMADALLTRERTVQQARAWWNSQGRFLVPREGDGDAWDEYTRRPVPEWVK